MPACELEVGVYCNRPRDHKLLGWLCAELATQFDGMIDLDGSLPFPDRQDWHRSGLAGTVLDVEYETHSGRTCQLQVVDATSHDQVTLREWGIAVGGFSMACAER